MALEMLLNSQVSPPESGGTVCGNVYHQSGFSISSSILAQMSIVRLL